ncbi:MAG TPA: hypothetical protein VIX19_17905 [Terriglobales bacterium]
MRRGAALVLARKDVDPSRLAYVGHSYDAEVGGFLSGVDKRFRAFVLMAGNLSDEVDMKSEEFKQFRLKTGPAKVDAFNAKYAWLDPGRFVSHAGCCPAAVRFEGKIPEPRTCAGVRRGGKRSQAVEVLQCAPFAECSRTGQPNRFSHRAAQTQGG